MRTASVLTREFHRQYAGVEKVSQYGGQQEKDTENSASGVCNFYSSAHKRSQWNPVALYRSAVSMLPGRFAFCAILTDSAGRV